jgi:hypothetical protein
MDGARKILLDLQTIGVKEHMWKKQGWIDKILFIIVGDLQI